MAQPDEGDQPPDRHAQSFGGARPVGRDPRATDDAVRQVPESRASGPVPPRVGDAGAASSLRLGQKPLLRSCDQAMLIRAASAGDAAVRRSGHSSRQTAATTTAPRPLDRRRVATNDATSARLRAGLRRRDTSPSPAPMDGETTRLVRRPQRHQHDGAHALTHGARLKTPPQDDTNPRRPPKQRDYGAFARRWARLP